jgi:uncharacterized protein
LNIMMNTKLTRKECLRILDRYGTPDHVIAHCDAVARVAVTIGEKLKEKGHDLDLDLIEAAGLLHDIARTSPKHEKVGEEHLRRLGLGRVADIVAVHMHYPGFNSIRQINETDLVCLGDRVCKEDQYVGVEERMDYVLAKANGNPHSTVIILQKKAELMKYCRELEEYLGITLDDLMKGRNGKTR